MMVVKLTEGGLDRVIDGAVGMTFIVDKITESPGGRRIAHVRDYRFKNDERQFTIWSIGPEGYQLVTP